MHSFLSLPCVHSLIVSTLSSSRLLTAEGPDRRRVKTLKTFRVIRILIPTRHLLAGESREVIRSQKVNKPSNHNRPNLQHQVSSPFPEKGSLLECLDQRRQHQIFRPHQILLNSSLLHASLHSVGTPIPHTNNSSCVFLNSMQTSPMIEYSAFC